jgi:hypothetical protein
MTTLTSRGGFLPVEIASRRMPFLQGSTFGQSYGAA